MNAARLPLEDLHPMLWRGSQLASGGTRVIPCGSEAMAAELPGGGWPVGVLTDLLVQQAGCGELRLLKPALAMSDKRPVILIQPPHRLQIGAFGWWGVTGENLTVLRPMTTADALWCAEQVLRAGTCAALLFWQTHVRAEALRRLHLAAQTTDMFFVMVRPLAAAADSSPAPLRLTLRPARGGVNIDFVKRRGPKRDEPLFVPLAPSPILNQNRHAIVDRRASPIVVPRSVPAEVVA
ncbi:translesion DNA synthesis-associated protein ImuA [Paraburkholderia sp. GAS334]|uniref:translesion DNA synthesis-associated protein ImuA n=1 Tax=Paraburkholderia sp. GAS334 TaxID=3035131 RepID=UPI003D214D95